MNHNKSKDRLISNCLHNPSDGCCNHRGGICPGVVLMETLSPIFLILSSSLFVALTTPTPRGSPSPPSNWTDSAPCLWFKQREAWLWHAEIRSPEAQESKNLCRGLKIAWCKECQEVDTLIINIRERILKMFQVESENLTQSLLSVWFYRKVRVWGSQG